MRVFPIFFMPCPALPCLACYFLVLNTSPLPLRTLYQHCVSISCNYFPLLFYSLLSSHSPFSSCTFSSLILLSYHWFAPPPPPLFTSSALLFSPLHLSCLISSHLLSSLLYLSDDDDDSPKKKKNGAQSWRKRDEGAWARTVQYSTVQLIAGVTIPDAFRLSLQ